VAVLHKIVAEGVHRGEHFVVGPVVGCGRHERDRSNLHYNVVHDLIVRVLYLPDHLLRFQAIKELPE